MLNLYIITELFILLLNLYIRAKICIILLHVNLYIITKSLYYY